MTGSRVPARRVALAAAMACALACACLAGGEGAPTLGGVRSEMERAARLIPAEEAGREVLDLQRDILADLDALIAREEAAAEIALQAREGEGAPGRPAATPEVPTRPAEESALPPGDWRRGRLAAPEVEGPAWLPELPSAEQKSIAEAFRAGRLPLRYVELLREYNRRLAEAEPEGE